MRFIRGTVGLSSGSLAFSCVLAVPAGCVMAQDQPATVERVDLDRYVGLWYEIAKIPNRFQAKCVGGATAYYALRDDGRVSVVNRCTDKDGKTVRATGIAKVEDAESNAKLKVSFVNVLGVWLFWGDYWIIGLDDDYRYAIVGLPKRDYGWILSRTRRLGEEKLDEIFRILRERGYDPASFEMTQQPAAP